MQYRIGPPPMNPLARLLAGLFGLLVLIGAFFFGFMLLAVALSVGLVAFLVIQVRFWWLRRKYGASVDARSAQPAQRDEESKPIEAEYEVVSREEDD